MCEEYKIENREAGWHILLYFSTFHVLITTILVRLAAQLIPHTYARTEPFPLDPDGKIYLRDIFSTLNGIQFPCRRKTKVLLFKQKQT